MFATALIVFREVLEAALIIGIVLAACRGIPHRGLVVSGGITAGQGEGAVGPGGNSADDATPLTRHLRQRNDDRR